MRQTVVALALTIAVASPLAAQTAPDFSEVRRILREGMVRESAPAAAFAVVRDGEILWGWEPRLDSGPQGLVGTGRPTENGY